MTWIPLFPCAPVTWWWRLGRQRIIILIWKTWPYLGPNSAIHRVQLRLRDLAKNNAVEFSIQMMQLTIFWTKLLRQEVEDFSGLFWSQKHGKCSVERLILHLPGKVNFLLQIYTKFRWLNVCLTWFYRVFFLRSDRSTELKQSFDRDSIDRMQKIRSAFFTVPLPVHVEQGLPQQYKGHIAISLQSLTICNKCATTICMSAEGCHVQGRHTGFTTPVEKTSVVLKIGWLKKSFTVRRIISKFICARMICLL